MQIYFVYKNLIISISKRFAEINENGKCEFVLIKLVGLSLKKTYSVDCAVLTPIPFSSSIVLSERYL